MLRKLLLVIFLLSILSPAFAAQPKFILLPNIHTQRMMQTDSAQAIDLENKAISLVKRTLKIDENSSYRTVRINLLYSNKNKVDALIVYLLSSQYKSFELVRINLNPDFTVSNVINHYQLQKADLMQLPAYAHSHHPVCPDESVQFVIGNNFDGEASVEREVQKVYTLAKQLGYNPILMNINDESTPQPTIEAYENWMSCPNVKGFYNESHGWEQGILLSDGDFDYRLINKNLVNKLNDKVVLFDSCETFHNPLLSSVTAKEKGNAQQYVAGIISLPFGPSERAASCFWEAAFNQKELNRTMLNDCSRKFHLKMDGFGIGGNGLNQLLAPTV